MATYISRINILPMVMRVSLDQGQNQEHEHIPYEITNYIGQMDNLPETIGLVPEYRVFTPTTNELNRFNMIINTPNTYTFFNSSGLTINFYLCNHLNLGLVMIYRMNDRIGWYRVNINNLFEV